MHNGKSQDTRRMIHVGLLDSSDETMGYLGFALALDTRQTNISVASGSFAIVYELKIS